MKNKRKNLLEKNWFCYVLILFFSGIICIPLLSSTIDIFQDDGIQHICRLIGTASSLGENTLFPIIMSDFCNEFGYSWNLFYSILTAYVPLLFRFFGASYVGCIKLFIYMITALSGFTMFAFTKRVTKSKKIALLASIFYILLPYRITDMYMRIAIAELASFVFLPMVFHGIYAILEDCQTAEKTKPMNPILIIGTVGLLLTHTVVTLYTAIFAFVYVVFQWRKLNKKAFLQLGISLVIILLLTAFFLVPFLEHRMATEYEVFQKGRMARIDVLEYYQLEWWQLFYTPSNGRPFEIGFMLLAGSIVAVISIAQKKLEPDEKKQTIFFLVFGIFCSILTLKIFPFGKLPEILCMIQFTFRLLEFVGFFLSFVAAVGIGRIFSRFDLGDLAVMSVISFLLLIPLNRFISYETPWEEEFLYPAVPVTENTQRVHAGCASFEYLPTKAFQNMDYIIHREKEPIAITGEMDILCEAKVGDKTTTVIKTKTEELSLELPYIYYLGYTVKIRQTGEQEWQTLSTYESEKGFLAVECSNIEQGARYEVEVFYTGTSLMYVSLMVSMLTLIGVLAYYLVYFAKKTKKDLEKIDEMKEIE